VTLAASTGGRAPGARAAPTVSTLRRCAIVALGLGACATAACSAHDRDKAAALDPYGDPGGTGPGGATSDARVEDSGPVQPAVCAPDDPAAVPVPPLSGSGFQVKLEGTKLSLYEGLVRATAFYADHAPLVADILVCNGDYENPKIQVSLSDHQYTWSHQNAADKPEKGYIVNVHALPSSQELAGRIAASVAKGVRIRVWGFEVDRIEYASGGYWTDTGCNTLLITHLCVE
jgi:hypothetical protein